jgi:hypothetical protein
LFSPFKKKKKKKKRAAKPKPKATPAAATSAVVNKKAKTAVVAAAAAAAAAAVKPAQKKKNNLSKKTGVRPGAAAATGNKSRHAAVAAVTPQTLRVTIHNPQAKVFTAARSPRAAFKHTQQQQQPQVLATFGHPRTHGTALPPAWAAQALHAGFLPVAPVVDLRSQLKKKPLVSNSARARQLAAQQVQQQVQQQAQPAQQQRPQQYQQPQLQLQQQPREASGVAIKVAGLAPTVSVQDVNELFGAVGDLKNVSLSNGTAIVTFVKKQHAATAVADYNGLALDGWPRLVSFLSFLTRLPPGVTMHISLVEEAAPTIVSRVQRVEPHYQQQQQQQQQQQRSVVVDVCRVTSAHANKHPKG